MAAAAGRGAAGGGAPVAVPLATTASRAGGLYGGERNDYEDGRSGDKVEGAHCALEGHRYQYVWSAEICCCHGTQEWM